MIAPDNLEKVETKTSVENVSALRRTFPQILASVAKNLLYTNLGECFTMTTIVIPSLIGISSDLNPYETVRITGAQSSWLTTFSYVAHPLGSLLSGPINDRIGRRTAIMLLNIPLILSWIILGFSDSFPLICLMFTLLGFGFGLEEAPVSTYISEISEPSIRGIMTTLVPISFTFGAFIVMLLGSVFSWRQVSLMCTLFPICSLIVMIFIPESPSWLLSKDRPKDAQRSLQWLRGWVSPQTVHKEFTELQNCSDTANACIECLKQSIRCYHSKPTIYDKIKELRRYRNIKPLILMVCFYLWRAFNLSGVWDPYWIQLLRALGTPIDPNLTTVLIDGAALSGCVTNLFALQVLGRRRIYLTTILLVALCSIALSIYGFIFFPLGWISFKRDPNDASLDPEYVRSIVGNYGYVPLVLILIMKFSSRSGLVGIPVLFVGEVFPYNIATCLSYILMSIASKTYYDIEMFLSLPGAGLFYGIVSLFGFITMYLIMPETENRTLEDIELHYSDSSKSLRDIRIVKNPRTIE